MFEGGEDFALRQGKDLDSPVIVADEDYRLRLRVRLTLHEMDVHGVDNLSAQHIDVEAVAKASWNSQLRLETNEGTIPIVLSSNADPAMIRS
jgi:hypothetical protein